MLATDAYTPENFDYYRRRMMPIASFIVVTRPLSPEEVAATLPGNRNYTNSLNIANYFRLTPDNRLLFGGRAKFSAASNQKTDVVPASFCASRCSICSRNWPMSKSTIAGAVSSAARKTAIRAPAPPLA
nr:hypothetical protein [Mesorhizobium sp.]